MKLIKLMETWLEEFPLAKQADVLGMEYAGYGRWKDKRTGKIVAKTVDGKLISTAGTGDDSTMSPADNPNFKTEAPIAGDSIEGHGLNVHSEHDPYMETAPKTMGQLYRAHTEY